MMFFKEVKGYGATKQILKYLDPANGGLARFQSTDSKIRRNMAIANKNKNMIVKYYDTPILEKYDKLDKVKYIDKYLQYGNTIKLNMLA